MAPSRRRTLALGVAALAPLASGCASNDDAGGRARSTTDAAPTDAAPTNDPASTTETATDGCEPPSGDLVADLRVRDDRADPTPFTVTVRRRDDAVVFEHTYADGDPAPSTREVFEQVTWYVVEVDVADGETATLDVEVTSDDWLRRYGVLVDVDDDGVALSEYHADPACP